MKYSLISVDDHLIEPPDVWTSRLPERFRDVGPRVVSEDGREYWVYEDRRTDTMGLNAVAGKDPSQWHNEPVRYSDMLPGCYDPKARLNDLAMDGILGSLCFPTLPRFSGTLFVEFRDKELADACVRAYNDFMIDEWCGAAPDIYIPLIISQLWDPALAAEEVRRCAARGARALSFPENPYPLGLPSFNSDAWDPLWDAMTETGLPLCLHIGTSGRVFRPSPDAHFITEIMASPIMSCLNAMIDIMMSPTLRRFPELKFVMSEGGIGWVPNAIERADRIWELNRLWVDTADIPPSEMFRRNFWMCFVDEPFGIENRDKIGIDKIMWECDYPHAETPWPKSQSSVEHSLGHLPAHEIEAITHGNAERVFRWTIKKD